ncbi:MAG: multifunctional CCA tRNA nucleotidyl transferase/2'3'-cyclic phosphodiesterase/2'nucleotidase/phosphatase [Gammaproteobacteria bacterium]
MKVYLVGGAVRDQLLDLPVTERDWVVVGATPEQMEAKGFRRLDRNFPVFAHPQTGEEYALARRETKVARGHKGFHLYAGPEVTLKEDLRRRDLTINAMAEAEDGTLIDPFGGRADLDDGFLRHVSPAFVEDPLRLLRVARFAARFARWGFRIAHRTHTLMQRMVESSELEELSAERIWRETKRALAEDRPVRYFEVLHRCGALTCLLPELDRALGPAVSHRRLGAETDAIPLKILAAAGKLSAHPAVRYAALMQGLASAVPPGEGAGSGVIMQVAQRFRVERSYRELALLVDRYYAFFKEANSADADAFLGGLETLDALRRRGRFAHYLTACQAVAVAEQWDPSDTLDRMQTVLAAVLGVDAKKLADQGLEGKGLADALRRMRVKAISAPAARSSCH